MNPGTFSLSLAVKNIHLSKTFYEKLGFIEFGGDINQNWLIMKNKKTTIGLFQGMFDKNILTFNPGWDENAQALKEFDDIRSIQKHLESAEVKFLDKAEENSKGPASFMIEDPDGNTILVDQHI